MERVSNDRRDSRGEADRRSEKHQRPAAISFAACRLGPVGRQRHQLRLSRRHKWSLFLVYIVIFWANATSIPLFARYFLPGVFQCWYLYTFFGYEVYLGETLLTLAVIAFVCLLCMIRATF